MQTALEAGKKSNVFDENGQTVEEVSADGAAFNGEAAETEEVSEEAATVSEEAGSGRTYRIGERTFATQAEALAYAQTALEEEQRLADAYRQGLRDGVPGSAAAADVTPQISAVPELNTEELYTNPEVFLQKYAQRIKDETLGEIGSREQSRSESDRIWREFTDRHPELADFRSEVEGYVAQEQKAVRAVFQTKGAPAAYDLIATKLKARFEGYASALKPKRALPNTGGGASPSGKTPSVTPKATEKKPLSFNEQIRNLRKSR